MGVPIPFSSIPFLPFSISTKTFVLTYVEAVMIKTKQESQLNKQPVDGQARGLDTLPAFEQRPPEFPYARLLS